MSWGKKEKEKKEIKRSKKDRRKEVRTRRDTGDYNTRSLLSSIYFLLMVFVELPLLLSMLSAVLWVTRPQRCFGRGENDLVKTHSPVA